MKHILGAVLPCLLCLLAGCASTGGTPLQGSVILPGVPFFKQEAYQCGPTVLATVVDYWYQQTGKGDRVTPEQIVPEIYSPSAKGVLGIDLEIYGKKHGFQGRQFPGKPEDLRAAIDLGIPPIIFVDYGFAFYQQGHFMVVTGYRPDGIIVNNGTHENQFISEEDIDRIWKKTGYWTLLLSPSI
jgi:ABC-type bacteriocin/lantibiotic exporter with double-glycine peptidase domain